MTHSHAPRWQLWLFVLAAAFILLVTIGMRMTLGLFVRPLVNDTALSIAEVSLAIAVTQLMWGVSQPLSGALSDRFGAWRVLWMGSLMLAAGVVHAHAVWFIGGHGAAGRLGHGRGQLVDFDEPDCQPPA